MRRVRGQIVALAPRRRHTGLVIEPQHRRTGPALRVAVDLATWRAMLNDRAPDDILGAWVTIDVDRRAMGDPPPSVLNALALSSLRWRCVTFDDGATFALSIPQEEQQ